MHAVAVVAEFRRWAIRRVEEEQKTRHPVGGGCRRCFRIAVVPDTGELPRLKIVAAMLLQQALSINHRG